MSEAASSPTMPAIRGIVAQILGVSTDKVVGSATLVGDLGGTSLDAAEIVMAIEDDFGIQISDDRAASVVTVGDLEALVLELTGAEQLLADLDQR